MRYVTVISALGSGLIAGLFFPFSTFAMRGLAKLPTAHGARAMQAINAAVAHSYTVVDMWFGAVFFGTTVACVIEVVAALLTWGSAESAYLLVGGLCYLAGPVLITLLFNIPLNDALAAVDPNSAEAPRVWARFLSRWTTWNHVRLAASLAAAAAFTLALPRMTS